MTTTTYEALGKATLAYRARQDRERAEAGFTYDDHESYGDYCRRTGSKWNAESLHAWKKETNQS